MRNILHRLRFLERDLMPYKNKTLGSVRIDLDEVRAICGAADAIEALTAALQQIADMGPMAVDDQRWRIARQALTLEPRTELRQAGS